jgi:two-component system, chemotaxis family, protein-glutamate methylesterase/glutaminase
MDGSSSRKRPTMSERELRVLVVDDSAINRRSLSEILAAIPRVKVIGKAANGEEALRLVSANEPDLVTLDLEMPRMDGFTFLRILMARSPIPVLVVSSYAQKENVFKALELGAVDFVTKPDLLLSPEEGLRRELTQKVEMLRGYRPMPRIGALPAPSRVESIHSASARGIVVIAASTGGPTALMEVVGALPKNLRASVLIAQHMPEKFTRTFAERLDRRSQLSVREGEHGAAIHAGSVWVSPGMRSMEVAGSIGDCRVRLVPPTPQDRFLPSADRLFRTAADVWGRRVIGVVLTGMADDGREGAEEIRRRGGRVLAESADTAVVFGMPRAVVEAGLADRVLRLEQVAEAIVDEVQAFCEGSKPE